MIESCLLCGFELEYFNNFICCTKKIKDASNSHFYWGVDGTVINHKIGFWNETNTLGMEYFVKTNEIFIGKHNRDYFDKIKFQSVEELLSFVNQIFNDSMFFL